MEAVLFGPHQSGARVGPFLRSPGISEDLRAAAAVMEGHRAVPDPQPPIQIAVRTGEHQQWIYDGLPAPNGEVPERLSPIARVCTAGARPQSLSRTPVTWRQIFQIS